MNETLTRLVGRPRAKAALLTVLWACSGAIAACTQCNPESPVAAGDDDGPVEAELPESGLLDVPGQAETGDTTEAGSDAVEPEACTTTAPPPSSATQPLTALPFTIEMTDSGTRLVVTVNVNGALLPAILDTGSSGLRVLQDAVEDAGLTPIADASVGIRFNGGLVLSGFVADANVTLGDLSIPSVPIQVVTSTCTLDFSADAAATDGSVPCDPVDSGVFGYSAILGIGLRPSRTKGGPTLRSPLASLSSPPSFFVHVAAANIAPSPDAGFVQIGVDGQGRAAFPYWVALDGSVPDWNDLGVQSCIRDETSDGPCWTQGTFLDTGDPSPYVETLDAGIPTPGEPLPAGDTAQVQVLGESGCLITEYAVPAQRVRIRRLQMGPVFNNLGEGFFLRMDVLYDVKNGWMAFRPNH